MRRPRTSSPLDETEKTNFLALATPDPRRRIQWLRSRSILAVRVLAIPALVTGLAVHNWFLTMIPVMILVQAVSFGDSKQGTARNTAAPAKARPLPAASAPTVALVFRSELARPSLAEPMFVEARHGQSDEPWYNGGGIGLTLNGMITATNGRNQSKAWWTMPGGRPPRPTADRSAPDTVTDRVAELAAICHRGFVRKVYLRDEHGRILASLPAAGLDGKRLSALARAAGIHYGRYTVSWTAHPSQSPILMDCFPRARTCVFFNGPDTPVAEPLWARGEGESAGPSRLHA
jgi:hypothetical protein